MLRLNQNFKIVIALFLSLIITILIGNNFFLGNSPRVNTFFVSSIPQNIAKFLSSIQLVKIVPTPSPIPFFATVSVTPPSNLQPQPKPTSPATPTTKPVPTTTNVIRRPTSVPTQTPIIPTSAPAVNCPTSSNQSYSTIRTNSDYNFSGPAENQPEINLGLRGYTKVNEKAGLVDYGGDTDLQALKINSLFADGRMPTIIYTYKVNAWDYSTNSRSSQTENAWPVSLIGLSAKPGESLVIPPSGREIGDGNELMVLYADKNRITFTNSVGDNWTDGYILHVEDICTDPNLISAYQNANSSGRGSLPALPKGKVFGTARTGEVKVAIRDSGQFMDPRSRKDWW